MELKDQLKQYPLDTGSSEINRQNALKRIELTRGQITDKLRSTKPKFVGRNWQLTKVRYKGKDIDAWTAPYSTLEKGKLPLSYKETSKPRRAIAFTVDVGGPQGMFIHTDDIEKNVWTKTKLKRFTGPVLAVVARLMFNLSADEKPAVWVLPDVNPEDRIEQ